jgi:CPA2 family monovalent cation:H+ antiporter-2
VSTVPEDATGELIVATTRNLAPQLSIISRAATETGVRALADLGAEVVIHPELEGSLEMVRHTLLKFGFPLR